MSPIRLQAALSYPAVLERMQSRGPRFLSDIILQICPQTPQLATSCDRGYQSVECFDPNEEPQVAKGGRLYMYFLSGVILVCLDTTSEKQGAPDLARSGSGSARLATWLAA